MMKRSVVVAIAVATMIKLAIAWLTVGSSDVITWQAFAENAVRCGECAYSISGPFGDPFNHPPFIIHFLKIIGTFDDFPFWLKLPAIFADIGTVLVVGRMRIPTTAQIALALNPVSILISAFHGNTDSVMVFFLVLAVYFITMKRFHSAAIAFGMALNIKVVPFLFVPALMLYLKPWRVGLRFFVLAGLVVLVASLPYTLRDPLGIVENVMGYSGMYGKWGTSRILVALGLSKSAHAMANSLFRPVMVVVLSLVSIWLNRKGKDLFFQLGAITFMFFFLTPALAVQYLVWPTAFVLSIGLTSSLVYYLAAASYLFLTYHYWSHGQWYLADSHIEPQWSVASYMAGFLCWAICGLICLRYKHMLSGQQLASSRNSVAEVSPV